jgi:hypothetical protein
LKKQKDQLFYARKEKYVLKIKENTETNYVRTNTIEKALQYSNNNKTEIPYLLFVSPVVFPFVAALVAVVEYKEESSSFVKENPLKASGSGFSSFL